MSTNKIKRVLLALGGAVALAGMSGCASLVNGEYQVVSVETYNAAGPVIGASCKLQNKQGIHYVTTPGSLSVYREYGPMTVTCDKPGLPTGTARFKSKTGYIVGGNILLPIGAMVDVGTGAAFGYPKLMRVMMDGAGTGTQAASAPAPVPASRAPSGPN